MQSLLYFMRQIHNFSGRILYINFLGMVLIGLLESVGIFLLIPLIQLTGILDFTSNEYRFTSAISKIFQEIPEIVSLSIILSFFVFIIAGQSFLQQKQLILNAKIQQSFIRFLRETTYKSILQASWRFFLINRKSDLINIMTNETNRVSAGVHLFLQFLASIVFTVIQVCLAFWLSPIMTLFVITFGFILLFLSRNLVKKSNNLGKNSVEISKMYLAGITDHFNGIKDIKSNTLEQSHIKWFGQMNLSMERNVLDFVKLKAKSQFIYKFISALLIAVFVLLSITMFNSHPGQLMIIMIIFSRIWPRITGIQSNLEQLGSIIPSFKALLELQNQCVDLREISEEKIYINSLMEIKEGLEVRNLYFRYHNDKPDYALQDINVNIPVNKMTAIVGPSGAGKSTLIDIIMGLNWPESGEVLVDGIPLKKDDLLSLRRSISYVPQDPFLFNGTIRDNLLVIDNTAREELMWEALEFASAATFVKKLPQGLDTFIGDRGIKLSGGERQRLVLARAILRRPAILVLDEATSALDSENESKIQSSLEKIKGQMTIIVIAHRLSTIKNADQVIVLDQGRIIQQGGYTQLASEQKGVFGHLLRKQMEAVL
jgi:ABC-type multidrug transport system fused ATPase/permease subunit